MKNEDYKNLRILIAEAKGIIAGMLRRDGVYDLHADAERALEALDSADWTVKKAGENDDSST